MTVPHPTMPVSAGPSTPADRPVPPETTTADDARLLGVGARLTVAVLHPDFAQIIVDALDGADRTDLAVVTDDVSTLVRGGEQRVLEYVTSVVAECARPGHHVSAHVLLSRGCPGEVTCEIAPDTLVRAAAVPVLDRTGLAAAAHWALYPLDDGATPGRDPDHLADIYAAIDHAKERGTYAGGEHYVTRLEGDLADVLATVAAGWVLVGRSVQHVTSHVTLSLNSPTGTRP